MLDFFDSRSDYLGEELNVGNSPKDPFTQFGKWIQEAIKFGIKDPNAMVLSTVDEQMHPHSRIVLMKEFNASGFIFFSNYQSAKGLQLANNPNATLLFFWKEFYRQVRIEGSISKLPEEKSDEYFNSRPYDSRINAIVSPQSHEIESKKKLIEAGNAIKNKFGKNIQRPAYWGGYKLETEYFEFWQGQPNRLHDRLTYKKQDHSWIKTILAP